MHSNVIASDKKRSKCIISNGTTTGTEGLKAIQILINPDEGIPGEK